MEISELTIRILLLFFPGIICTLIVDSMTVHRERNTFVFVVHSFVFGLSCYLIFYFAKYVLDQIPYITGFIDPKVNFLDALLNTKVPIDYFELIKTTIYVAIPFALFISWLLNDKVFHRFAQRLRVTRKFGEIGVWEYVFGQQNIGWVWVRDIKNDLVFQGLLKAFSDSADDNELLLIDVTVFRNSTGDKLYKVDGLYIARDRNEMTIEFPQIKSGIVAANQQEKSNE